MYNRYDLNWHDRTWSVHDIIQLLQLQAPVGTTSLPPTAAPTGVEAVLPNTEGVATTPPENPYAESSASLAAVCFSRFEKTGWICWMNIPMNIWMNSEWWELWDSLGFWLSHWFLWDYWLVPNHLWTQRSDDLLLSDALVMPWNS